MSILNVNNLYVGYKTLSGYARKKQTTSERVPFDQNSAVNGISFEIHAGEIFGIIGESGSGKTSVCNAVMGNLQTNEQIKEKAFHSRKNCRRGLGKTVECRIQGRICFNGQEMLTHRVLNAHYGFQTDPFRALYSRHIAMLPQGIHALNPLLTIGEHIKETLNAHQRISSKEARIKSLSLLKTFRLTDARRVYHQYPHQMSGGMARRALMAIAFCCEPDLVIADEPTRGLDRQVCIEILEELVSWAKERGGAILMVTHDLDVAAACDRIAVLREGQIVETGKARQVLISPKHPYTQTLLNARPGKRYKNVNHEDVIPQHIRKAERCYRYHGGDELQPLKLLSVRNLSKSFQRQGPFSGPAPLFQEISFQVNPGEILGVMGPSGSGKSTMARILVGMISSDTGEAWLSAKNGCRNLDILHMKRHGWREVRQRIQMITQFPESALNPKMTIRDALREPFHLLEKAGASTWKWRGAGKTVLDDQLIPLLESVKLSLEHLERYPHQLSGGELQRVMIARVMALQPDLIIADEPTSNLDMISQMKIIRLMVEKCRKSGTAMMLISHDEDLVGSICDRVYRIHSCHVSVK